MNHDPTPSFAARQRPQSDDDDSALLNAGVKPGERVVSAGVNSLKPGQTGVILDVVPHINPGERIVTAGVNSLKPGQKVKIDEDSPR